MCSGFSMHAPRIMRSSTGAQSGCSDVDLQSFADMLDSGHKIRLSRLAAAMDAILSRYLRSSRMVLGLISHPP